MGPKRQCDSRSTGAIVFARNHDEHYRENPAGTLLEKGALAGVEPLAVRLRQAYAVIRVPRNGRRLVVRVDGWSIWRRVHRYRDPDGMVGSLAFDHFVLSALPHHPTSLVRLLGAGCLIAGVIVIRA